MWFLRSVANPDLKYGILPGKEYVIGRKDCSILIEGDKSISRLHATLTVSQYKFPSGTYVLKLRDLKSKFGSFVNENKMASGSTEELKNGDGLRFGLMQSDWRVYWEPMVVTTSCITSSADKKALREAVARIGGKMVGEWQEDCTFLVMTQLTVTVKAVCALITCKPIVTPTYFQSLVETIDSKSPGPDPKQYLPPLAEASLQEKDIDFHPDERRRTIFCNKKFLFLSSKQHKKMRTGIELGGGEAIYLTSKPDEDTLLIPGVCVMNFPPDLHTQADASEWAEVITAMLQRHSRRTIPEAELGLAVLHCSTAEYCNPEFNFGSALIGQFAIPSQSLSQNSELYVMNTESPSRESHPAILTQSLISVSMQQKFGECSKTSTIPETRGEIKPNTRQSMETGMLTNTEKSTVRSVTTLENSLASNMQETSGSIRQNPRQSMETGTSLNTEKRAATLSSSVMPSADLETESSVAGGKRQRPKENPSSEPPAKAIKLETQLESASLEPQSCYSEVISTAPSASSSNLFAVKREISTRPTTPPSDDEMSFEWDKPVANSTVVTSDKNNSTVVDVKHDTAAPSLIPVNHRNGHSSSVSNHEERIVVIDNVHSAVVEFCPLIKKKAENSTRHSQSDVLNFKKFKKVEHLHSKRLPDIISVSDTVAERPSHRPKPIQYVEDMDMDEATGQRQQQQKQLTQDEDLFDW